MSSFPSRNEHLRFRLRLLEVVRDLAGSLVRSGRAAEGRLRHREDVHAAVAHRFELLAQLDRLRSGLPGMQNGLLRLRVVEPGNLVVHEVDARRDHEPVVREILDLLQPHPLPLDEDLGDLVADDLDAVLAQLLVAERQVADAARAAENEVGQRAGNELRVALDQEHLDATLAPHPDVLRAGRAAVAAADDDHPADRLDRLGRPGGARGEDRRGGGRCGACADRLEETAPVEVVGAHCRLLISLSAPTSRPPRRRSVPR